MVNTLPNVVNNKKKLIRLGIIVVVLIIAVVAFLLIYVKTWKFPSTSVFQKKAVVQLKTEYKNPFEKETQYVNPFETYKNPFVVAK